MIEANDTQLDRRHHYKWFLRLTTRWMDNDVYGHVNNVHYYSYFDSTINQYLIDQGGLDIHRGECIAYIVRSECDYLSAIAYPQEIDVGLSIVKLGNSSVRYALAIFEQEKDAASAVGSVTHVFVDRKTERPVAIPEKIRNSLEAIRCEASSKDS